MSKTTAYWRIITTPSKLHLHITDYWTKPADDSILQYRILDDTRNIVYDISKKYIQTIERCERIEEEEG